MGLTEKICIFVFLLKGVCCREFDVTLPEKIQALTGSCVMINCKFEIKEEFDKDLTESDAIGLWYKVHADSTKTEVFNSRYKTHNHFEGKTGKLHKKNCTTILYNVSSNHNGKYFFRIEGKGPLKWNFEKTFVVIEVIESPAKPTVKLYEEQKEGQEEVLEGRSVSLRCSAETLCSSPPPTLTWSPTPTIPFSESSRQQELISDLNFTATRLHHRVTFTCTITYQLQDKNKTAHNNITLHVQYSPKNTFVSVFPSGSVVVGSSVNLTCSSDANPAVVDYTWFRESEGHLKKLQTGDTLTFNRTVVTHRGLYFCQAHNKHGTQNSSGLLDIQYAPQISTSPGCNGTDVTVCVCEIDGNPSPKVEWHLSGRPASNSSHIFISEERLGSTGLRSLITLHRSHTSTLQCVGRNTHGSAKQLFSLVVITQREWFNIYSLLAGVVAGTSFVAILWAITLLYKRAHGSQRGDKTGLTQAHGADSVDNGEQPSQVMMPSAESPTLNHPETLHYSSINFINSTMESNDIRGVSSLTAEYAVVCFCHQNVADNEAKIRVSSVPSEDAIYQVSHKAVNNLKNYK